MNKIIRMLVTVGIAIFFIFAIDLLEGKSEDSSINTEEKCYGCIIMDDSLLANEIEGNKLVTYQTEVTERREIVAEKKRLEAERLAKAKAEEEARKKYVAVSRGEKTKGNTIVFEATHYSAFCSTGCTGKTALGYDVRNTIYEQGYRVIAVDPKVIKLGSLVEVTTSYGSFKALAGDTGGDIKGYKIDILVENDSIAYKLGREKVQVRIIK